MTEQQQTTEQLKVGAESPAPRVAGSLAKVIRQGTVAHLDCVGAGAVNQAVKGIAIARSYLVADGLDLVAVPEFLNDVPVPNGERRTGMRLVVRGVRL